ncbi:MAG: hypothetical protein AB8C46_10945 [Burkholderiaceae bacterium]
MAIAAIIIAMTVDTMMTAGVTGPVSAAIAGSSAQNGGLTAMGIAKGAVIRAVIVTIAGGKHAIGDKDRW